MGSSATFVSFYVIVAVCVTGQATRTVCGGHERITPDSTWLPSIFRSLHRVTRTSNQLYILTNNLANNIVSSRVFVPRENIDTSCARQMVKEVNTEELSVTNLETNLLDDYGKLLHMASVLNIIIIEDNEVEFQAAYSDIINIIYDTLCALNTALRIRGVQISRQPELPEVERICSVTGYTFARYVRDLELITKLRQQFGNICLKYNTFRKLLLSGSK